MTMISSALSFDLPPGREATSPPETRGLRRDQVRLLVGQGGAVSHRRFDDLGDALRAGDLLVVNDSETLAAALPATREGVPLRLHLSTLLDDETWVVEMRGLDNRGPVLDGYPGQVLKLPGGSEATLETGWNPGVGGRLWKARLSLSLPLPKYLRRYGAPIRYSYVKQDWPLEAYQTVFARRSADGRGSAEMPSAGRPFSRRLVAQLERQGIAVRGLTLHTGVSSLEAHEPPSPEWFSIPESTAAAVAPTRRAGGRVIAVGTTVARALESAGDSSGEVAPSSGWTDLVIGPDRPANVVDGIISGWHTPEASHLSLLESIAGRPLLELAYDAALAAEYLWHEFGDSVLLLPSGEGSRSS